MLFRRAPVTNLMLICLHNCCLLFREVLQHVTKLGAYWNSSELDLHVYFIPMRNVYYDINCFHLGACKLISGFKLKVDLLKLQWCTIKAPPGYMCGRPLPGLVLTKYISSRQIIIFWNTYKKDIWCQLDLSDEYLKFKRKWCIEFTYLKLLFCYKKKMTKMSMLHGQVFIDVGHMSLFVGILVGVWYKHFL